MATVPCPRCKSGNTRKNKHDDKISYCAACTLTWREGFGGSCVEITSEPSDPVNKPAHYRTGNIEVIDFIEDQKLGYHLGNVVKYVCRHLHKGTPLQDLKKAAWYLNRAIEKMDDQTDLSMSVEQANKLLRDKHG